jgi:hypothetical protein
MTVAVGKHKDLFEMYIPYWLERTTANIVAYTDFKYPSTDRLRVVKSEFPDSREWFEIVGYKAEKIQGFVNGVDGNFAFVDMDCFIVRDFDEVFEGMFDLGITVPQTRMPCGEYSINCGVFFGKPTAQTKKFIDAWVHLQDMYYKRGKGLKDGENCYDQWAFSECVKACRGEVVVKELDGLIYNSRRILYPTVQDWERDCVNRASIIHMTNRRWKKSIGRRIIERVQSA